MQYIGLNGEVDHTLGRVLLVECSERITFSPQDLISALAIEVPVPPRLRGDHVDRVQTVSFSSLSQTHQSR